MSAPHTSTLKSVASQRLRVAVRNLDWWRNTGQVQCDAEAGRLFAVETETQQENYWNVRIGLKDSRASLLAP